MGSMNCWLMSTTHLLLFEFSLLMYFAARMKGILRIIFGLEVPRMGVFRMVMDRATLDIYIHSLFLAPFKIILKQQSCHIFHLGFLVIFMT